MVKILRFDLLAFGPFTNLYLNLDGGCHGLHLIHGPNEAGKSSALRALKNFLYGIPATSSDNFIHAYTDLRLGASLQNGGGEILECIRRKGNKNTLRAADDIEVVDPSQLAGMLNGVDEESFRRRFGIDYDELVEGGRAVVEGGGDLGEILFAAGSGIADLGKVQSRLAEDAEELFKPRGSTQKINKALAELAKVQQELRAAQLPSTEWVKHHDAKAAAEARRQQIDVQLTGLTTERNRLSRIEEALPIIIRREKLLTDLKPFHSVTLLRRDFAESRSAAAQRLLAAQEADRDATRQVEEIEGKLAGASVPTLLLDHQSAIERLHTDLGSHRKAAKDRVQLVSQLQRLEQDACVLLKEIGREPGLDGLDELRISRSDRRRIQELGGERSKVELAHSQAVAKLNTLNQEIQRLTNVAAGLELRRDANELRQAVRAARQHGDLDSQLRKARAELRQLQAQAEIALPKLGRWSGSLEELERLPIPAAERIDRFEKEMDRAAARLDQAHQSLRESQDQSRELDEEIERVRLERDVPTEDDLSAARSRRDEGWQLVKHAWKDGVTDGEEFERFVSEFASAGELSQAFEQSIVHADQLADRLRREAREVAAKAQRIAQRDKLAKRIAQLEKEQQEARSSCEQLQNEWRDEWTPLGIEPLTPREMRSWSARHSSLVKLAESIRRQCSIVEDFDATITACRQNIARCLAAAGEPLSSTNELAGMLEAGEELIKRIDGENHSHQSMLDKLGEFKSQLPEAARLVAQTAEVVKAWRQHWSEKMALLNLSDSAAVTEANSVLESIDEIVGKTKDAELLRERIKGIDSDAEQFAAAVHKLVEQVAPDLIDLPCDQAVADLHDKLVKAQRMQERLDNLMEQYSREKFKRDKARDEIALQQAALESLCREAGCASAAELPDAEQRSDLCRRFQDELRQVEDRLAGIAIDADLERFVADAKAVDADQLETHMRQLTDQIKQLEDERGDLLRSIGSEEAELKRMNGNDQAAQAQEHAEALTARIGSDVEQFVRLRLAASILAKAIERYREKHQGPVLRRASDLFAQLTLGSFEGLRADYDERGHAVLVGVRPGGRQVVGVDGMSDGTCDQLYLSVRLAILESRVGDRECIPLIVDDILIKFDDERAIAALRVLAEFSCKTQVIFFTHHEHLVRLAQDNLEKDVLFVHRLNCRSA